ncbi:MAG: Zn-ribbon domain-containing OB-fold protein [Dehalococcoidia bacterium]
MTTEYNKPLPRPISVELTRPFWEAAKRHELVMPRCTKCDHFFFYPREECPRCFSRDIEWAKVSGNGRLHTYTIVHQPASPAFQEDAPHVYAVVQLDEGPRMISNIVECELDALQVDMPLVPAFDDVTPEWTLVKFKPA